MFANEEGSCDQSEAATLERGSASIVVGKGRPENRGQKRRRTVTWRPVGVCVDVPGSSKHERVDIATAVALTLIRKESVMAANWRKLSQYLAGLNLPVGSRVGLPVDYLTQVVGDWPHKASTPTYWAADKSPSICRCSGRLHIRGV